MRDSSGKAYGTGKSKIIGALLALAAATAVFGVMLFAEKNMLTKYERGIVYTAAAQIPRGQLITEDNLEQYFTETAIDKDCIGSSLFTSLEQLTGLRAAYDIIPGTFLAEGMFESENKMLERLTDPVIAGFKGEDLYQVVGGVLRAGDRIHIYSVSEEMETTLLWEDVFVQGVFDQNGLAIDNGNSEAAAQRINVYLNREDTESFYSGLAQGNLRVVKVCR